MFRKEFVRGCISVIAGLVVWEILTRLFLEDELLIPPPSSVLRSFSILGPILFTADFTHINCLQANRTEVVRYLNNTEKRKAGMTIEGTSQQHETSRKA